MSENQFTGLLGASSFVGGCLMPLLMNDARHVVAFSRNPHDRKAGEAVTWRQLNTPLLALTETTQIKNWLCVAPIWVLPQYFAMLESYGACRVVALSSTSRFTKTDSSDVAENAVAVRLAEGEEHLQKWAESRGIEWVILRPTLIYGRGRDKNIVEIANFIRRFGFFPLLGKAMGLRQPIHVEDVAATCIAALNSPMAANRAYNISGAERLPYREMVSRVFTSLQHRPRMVTIPLIIFKMAVTCLRLLPRYRQWSAAMAERMNRDLVFDHSEATRDLGFKPRSFVLSSEDVGGGMVAIPNQANEEQV